MTTPARSLFFCILLYCSYVSALYTDIYTSLDAAACVLLLDKNGKRGCTTPQGGSVGDLYVVRNTAEMDYFVGHVSDHTALAMPTNIFNRDSLNRLKSTGKIKGILLLYGPPSATGWSPDTTSPNSQWGLPTDSNWNPPGDGLNFEEIPFPVYSLSANESQTILGLATNDTSYPRHAIKFNTFMHATSDAKTCLRRGQCIPIGGKSVWASFNKLGNKPIIMAMANIDSTALFHDLATGADSTASGIVGLVGAALALQNVDKSAFVRDILFSFWAGESWGYLGSKKFVDDILHFNCTDLDTSSNTCNKPYKPDLSFENIKLQNIEAAIEFNQIGLPSSPNNLVIHQQSNAASKLTSFLKSVSDNTFNPPLNSSVMTGIPPSSLMSFLMASPNLPGVVVTDHEGYYSNKNFHSHSDTGDFNKLDNATLCNAATVLARALYLMGMNKTEPDSVSPTITAPCALLSDLAVCLSSDFNCPLLDNFLDPYRATVPSYYTGVFGYAIYNAYASAPAVLLYNLMTLITATNGNYNFTSNNFSVVTERGCRDCEDNQTCIAGFCVNGEAHYHDAISLGFDWDYSNDMWIVVNDSEPLWVESNWDSISVELFRRANPTTEGVFLAAGIIEFIVSLVAVYYAKKYFTKNYKIF